MHDCLKENDPVTRCSANDEERTSSVKGGHCN